MTDVIDRGAAAFVAAAVGDALGWPQENRSSNIDRKIPPPAMAFRSWHRRGGGRFNAYEEVIGAGDYSDDTQMICAVARSLTAGHDAWHDWLTGVELPLLPLYQRGGGRALLAACRAWAAGVAPWHTHRESDPSSYFRAGGNGGAMRVLPHALAAAIDGGPVSTANLFSDVVATHGHPRAAVGAAVQAASLRAALVVDGTLGYGDLIDTLLGDPDAWASLPDVHAMPDGWLAAWSATVKEDFEQAWRSTVDEMTALLITARRGMSAGALASEEETLRALGCTGTKTVGSGTVSAAGAVFLASRSAANPRSGLLSAAFLPKADTDTLASMTASILGAFAGQGWLAPLDTQVQDGAYIMQLAREVAAGRADARPSTTRVTKVLVDRLTKQLEKAVPGGKLELADGRAATLIEREALVSKTQSSAVERVRLVVGDGQTIHIVRVHRRPRGQRPLPDQQPLPVADPTAHEAEVPSVVRVGVKVSVTQLDTMRRFYQDILGMRPTRSGKTFMTFNDILALASSQDPEPTVPSRISIYLDVVHLEALWQRVQEHDVRVVDPLGVDGGRRRFRCLDPEGNLLEVRDNAPGAGSAGQLGFTEEDLLAASKALLAEGRVEVSVLDVLSYIKGSLYVPPPLEPHLNDLPFASACNGIEALAARGSLRVKGKGSELRIVGVDERGA